MVHQSTLTQQLQDQPSSVGHTYVSLTFIELFQYTTQPSQIPAQLEVSPAQGRREAKNLTMRATCLLSQGTADQSHAHINA